tara:strand:+ start:1112 stop:1759 length:648 start_codon:yes stop_codon:yes gene_type:complete
MRNQHTNKRDPKKTVSIEVRVSEEEKRAFSDACRAANRSVSGVLRRLMDVFVSLQSIRQRTFDTMTFLLFRPVRTAITAISATAVLSMSFVFLPSASADMRMAYQVSLDDGIGVIVSEGVTEFGSETGEDAPIGDMLGETVRFTIAAQPCGASAGPSCPEGAANVVISVWEYQDGQGWRATDRGLVTAETGETRFEERLGDGRSLQVTFTVLQQS